VKGDTWSWAIGLSFAVIGGVPVTEMFLKVLRYWLRTPNKPTLKPKSRGKSVPAWLTGVVERLFITILMTLDVSGLSTAMVGWIGVKLATNWNHPAWTLKAEARTFGFSALLGSLGLRCSVG